MTFYLSPLRGSILFMLFVSLGLTPQAMHMSLLRSFRAAVPELWCGRLGGTSSMLFGNVRAGRPHHNGSPAFLRRLTSLVFVGQWKDGPRSRKQEVIGPSFGAAERRQIFSLGREPQEQDAPKKNQPRSGDRFPYRGVRPSVWI
jgi:hypothetical protein